MRATYIESAAALFAVFVFSAVAAVASTSQPEGCNGLIYLGGARANALLIDVPTRQALYTRHIEEPGWLLEAMRKSPTPQPNISACGEQCVDIRLEEGRIVLAFRQGAKGIAYEAAGVQFKIEDVATNAGLGLGDLYWIAYRSNDKNNAAGVFAYSTNQGVMSVSMADERDVRSSALGATFSLAAGPGLLSDVCAVR